jgi:hypothetical protein
MDLDLFFRYAMPILSLLLSGGAVAIWRFIYTRRAELRKLRTSAEVDVSGISDKMLERLQSDVAIYRDQIATLQTRVTYLEDRYDAAQQAFSAQLRDAHLENTRLTTRIAQLQNDLDIAYRQVDDMRRRP